MNMAKRIAAFLLALVWALALCACSVPGADSPSPTPDTRPSAAVQGPSSPSDTQLPSAAQEPSAPLDTPQAETQPAQTPEEPSATPDAQPSAADEPSLTVSEDGWYDSKEEVALYLHLYGHLPGNYVTKEEAQSKGWTGGSVEPYTGEGTALGGSRFGNYEGLLPKAPGRTYTECDIGTVGKSSRGARRLVFSNDGLIYYTEDHYESFVLLYGEP